MGHRLSKIVTRTGDAGTSALSDNRRRDKCEAIFEAIGDIDEVNAHIGVMLTQLDSQSIPAEQLTVIQHQLFNIGAELSMPELAQTGEHDIDNLESCLASLNSTLSPLKEFILPGGHQAAAQAHVCRCTARRAERSLVAASHECRLSHWLLQYVNRLSDYFFVLARYINHHHGHGDVYWQSWRIRKLQESGKISE